MLHALKVGKLIDDYKLIIKIGRGSFGQIFYVENIHNKLFYAMKLESNHNERKFLQFEQSIYKQIDPSVYFPEFVKYGKTKHYNFLVMEVFGPSLETLCRTNDDRHLSLSTTLRLSIEMLHCINEYHKNKFIHRDIKPGNFVIRNSKIHPVVLIDFGLSRQYINNNNGDLIKARERPGYVGTNMYASVNAYSGLELSQRDDLFSWFYSVIKIVTGKLPWDEFVEDRCKTYHSKILTSIEQLTCKMPRQFKNIYDIITALAINETPDYNIINDLIIQAMEENGCKWNDPYDWEMISNEEIEKISIIPMNTYKENDLPDKNVLETDIELIDDIENESNIQESLNDDTKNCCFIA